MIEEDRLDVQSLFNAATSDSVQVKEPTIQGINNRYGGAALLKHDAVANINFGKNTPFVSKDMMDYFSTNGIRSGEICSVLSVTNNRLSSMVKTANDGREMSCEYISPTLEIFLRLLIAYPQYSPWRKITVQDVADVTGFDVVALAEICGSSETAGERWSQDTNATNPSVAVLLKLIYNMASNGVDQVVFREVSQFVKNARNNHETSRLVNDNSWNSVHDQTFRKVRKVFRVALNDLMLDGATGKLPNATTSDIIKQLILNDGSKDDAEVAKLKARASATGLKLENALTTIRLSLLWNRTRNAFQKSFVTEERQSRELAAMPEARRIEYLSKKANHIVSKNDVAKLREELGAITLQLEKQENTALQL
jgi:hypothetical protein